PRPIHRVLWEGGRVPHSFAHFANEWALDCRKTLDRTTPGFQRPFLKLHPHRSCLSITIRPETAPLPLFGQLHQSPLHRVPVHIAQLLDVLPRAPHISRIRSGCDETHTSQSARCVGHPLCLGHPAVPRFPPNETLIQCRQRAQTTECTEVHRGTRGLSQSFPNSIVKAEA